jgi:hypothetical protein
MGQFRHIVLCFIVDCGIVIIDSSVRGLSSVSLLPNMAAHVRRSTAIARATAVPQSGAPTGSIIASTFASAVDDPLVLMLSCVTHATQAKYLKAVDRFADWCATCGVDVRSAALLDYHMARYMVRLWNDGYGKAEATAVFYGLDMLVPGMKYKLPWAARCLRGFCRLCPSTPWPPLPYPATVAISGWLAVNAAHHRLAMAVSVLLSFDCYLRAGELLGIYYEDVATGSDRRVGLKESDRVHIHLRVTKTGEHKGVEVQCSQVKQLLLQVKRAAKPGDRLFPWSRSTHSTWFKKACADLCLSPDYVHHSLRHGGATRDYLNGMTIGDIMVRGRWVASKSATHYIQQGRQLLMMHEIPLIVDRFGREGSGMLVPLLTALSQFTM